MSEFAARIRGSTRARWGLGLAAAFAISFFIRVYFPYHNVFAGDWVRFQETDAWLHMEVVENLVHNFPHRMMFDPFTYFPFGQLLGSAPLFDLMLGFIVWVLGAGSPSTGLIETVGAYFPAVLGALVTIPVFFIGKELFNNKLAGLLAALLIAILPGEFLYRSLLGFTDHHAAEVLFSTTAMLFFILAFKSARGAGVSFSHVRDRNWDVLRRPLLWSLLAGLALAFYLLTWTGGSLFLFVVVAFAVVQYILDHLRRRTTDYLCICAVPALALALVLIAPAANSYSLWSQQVASLVICMVVFAALSAVSVLMARRNMSPVYYPLAIAGLVGLGIALFFAIDASLLRSMLDKLGVLSPSGGRLTISEAQGMSIKDTWDFFTTSFWLFLAGLGLLAYLIYKEGTADKTLLFVWSLIMLVAAFGQQRFAYYLVVNVALLAAYFSWRLLELAGLRESRVEAAAEAPDKPVVMPVERRKAKLTKKAKRRKELQRKRRAAERGAFLTGSRVIIALALIVVFFMAFYPNFSKAKEWAEPQYGPNDDWHEALTWMRANTPDPFLNPDFYYQRHETPPNNRFEYPESAYGVMAWWDPGTWITYIAHRIPNASSRNQKGAPDAAEFLLAQDEASADEVLDRLGSKYVILEAQNAFIQATAAGISGELQAYAVWAGQDPRVYFDVYYKLESGSYTPVLVYHPAYYYTMISRLYLFDAVEWVPSQTDVVSVEQRAATSSSGQQVTIKVITDQQTFDNYPEAADYVKTHSGSEIIGTQPYVSPVPLEAMEHYELVHKSPTTVVTRTPDSISAVEIFEYSG
jgi:oligosaccharyl transferase (archaeosortase A-associated)